MNDENEFLDARKFDVKNNIREYNYDPAISSSKKFMLNIINIPENYHHKLSIKNLFEIDFLIESSLTMCIELHIQNNIKKLSLSIQKLSFNKISKNTLFEKTFGESNLIIKPNHNNIDNFEFSISHEINDLSIKLSQLETFKRLIFNGPKTSKYIIETTLDENGHSFFNEIFLEVNTNFLITHKTTTENKAPFFSQNLDNKDFYLKVETLSSDHLIYSSKKIFNKFFLHQENIFEKITVSNVDKIDIELKNKKQHLNNTNFIFNNINKIDIDNLQINRLEISNNQEVFINDSNIDCIKITNNKSYEFNNVKCYIAKINNNYFYCLNLIKKAECLDIIDDDELYSQSNIIKILNEKYYKEHPLSELLFQNNKTNATINKNSTIKIITSNIHMVQINFMKENEIIYFENLFYNFLDNKYDIEFKNFDTSKVLFLPFKEGTLKEIIPRIKNLTLNDLYHDQIDLEKILKNDTKNKQSIAISLGFIESELRAHKIIQKSNEFAVLCEQFSLHKKNINLIDKLWGCKFFYQYGYHPNPFKTFIIIFITLMIINFIFYYVTNIPSILNIDEKTIIEIVTYLIDALLPTFKLSSTGWLKLSAFITNLTMALNFLGLGISLKRRYSRNTS